MFSEIIFDQIDIRDSMKYSLEYFVFDVYNEGGFYPIPQ